MLSPFARVAQMVAQAVAASASKASVRQGVAVTDSDGHVQVQIGAQIFTVTDGTGSVRTGDRVSVVEQGNTAQILRVNGEQWAQFPPGMVVPWFASSPPSADWWFMQGQAINAGTYPTCAAIFGANLPDARDRFFVGASGSKSVRSSGGSSTISTGNLPAHSHSIPDHDHSVGNSGSNIGASGSVVGEEFLGSSTSRGWRTGSGGGGNTGNAGSGSAYWQPYIAVNWIVRMG